MMNTCRSSGRSPSQRQKFWSHLQADDPFDESGVQSTKLYFQPRQHCSGIPSSLGGKGKRKDLGKEADSGPESWSSLAMYKTHTAPRGAREQCPRGPEVGEGTGGGNKLTTLLPALQLSCTHPLQRPQFLLPARWKWGKDFPKDTEKDTGPRNDYN